MAKLSDSEITAALQAHMEPGEELRQWAVGITPPGAGAIVASSLRASATGMASTGMSMLSWMVGLTDKRLIALHIKGLRDGEVLGSLSFDLSRLAREPGQVKSGWMQTRLRIDWPDQPWQAQFNRLFASGHRAQALEIGAAISGASAP